MSGERAKDSVTANAQMVSGLMLGIIACLGLVAIAAAALLWPDHAPALCAILIGNTVMLIDLLRGEKRSNDIQSMIQKMNGRLDDLLSYAERAARAEGLAEGLRAGAESDVRRPGQSTPGDSPHRPGL
jgi:hypothetical protein